MSRYLPDGSLCEACPEVIILRAPSRVARKLEALAKHKNMGKSQVIRDLIEREADNEALNVA